MDVFCDLSFATDRPDGASYPQKNPHVPNAVAQQFGRLSFSRRLYISGVTLDREVDIEKTWKAEGSMSSSRIWKA